MQRRRGSRKKAQTARFSLLLLEDGEYFLEDFSAYRVLEASTTSLLKTHGRIKVCTRGLFFVPDDLYLPILRFPFRAMLAEPVAECFLDAGQTTRGLVTPYLTFRTKTVIEMKQRGIDHPYVTRETSSGRSVTPAFSPSGIVETPSTYIFTLLYSSVDSFLANIHIIYEVANLPRRSMTKVEEEALLAPVLAPRLVNEFDPSLLVDFRERLVLPEARRVERIEPLLRYPGCVMLTDQRIYFQPAQLNNVLDPVMNWSYTQIDQVYRRRYLLRNTGLEIYFKHGDSCFFSFPTCSERDEVYETMMIQPELQRCRRKDLEYMMRRWQRREISNFDYLLFLNNASGRTRNDLTQYPVFPWIISDYTSNELNLENPDMYRDLSKPIGALNPERLEFFKMRYEIMPRGDDADGMPPPFLYGTHYSTPGYVLYFLVRMAAEYMLCLQNGRFDAPDRLFRSIKVTWEGCLSSHTDVKELIPEFYDLSFPAHQWLQNLHHLDLGTTQTLERVDDIELPPWSRGDPELFVKMNRQALESEYVSNNIHHWIDLIFGYKQQGEEAIKANNLFYYLSYEGAVDLEAVEDPVQKASLESQIQEFGQTPKLLFSTPHPQRSTGHGNIKVATPDLLPSPRVVQPQVRRQSYPAEVVRRKAALHSSAFTSGYDSDDDEAGGAISYRPPRRHRYSLFCVQTPWAGLPHAIGRFARHMWTSEDRGSKPKRWEWKRHSSASWKWELSHSFPAHSGEVTCAVLSRSDDTLFTTSKDSSMKVVANREIPGQSRNVVFDMPLSCCEVSSDGQFVFLGCWDNRVYMYSLHTNAVIDKIFAHADGISAICVLGHRLLTSSWDSTIKLWSYSASGIDKTPVRTFLECNDSVLCLDATSDGMYAAAGVRNGRVYLINLDTVATKMDLLVSPRRLGDVTSISFSADSKSFVCVTIENEILKFSLTGEQLWSLDCNVSGQIRCFESDGEFAVGGTTSGRLVFWRLHAAHDYELICSIPDAHDASVSALVVSSSGSEVISGAADGSIRVWKLQETSTQDQQPPVAGYRAVPAMSMSVQDNSSLSRRSRKSKRHKRHIPKYHSPAFYVPALPAQAAEAQLCLEM